MSEKKKEYTNGKVTVVWKPEICIHAGHCANDLPEVFKPTEKPWVDASGASTESIISQVKKCPSGALSYFMNNENEKTEMEQAVTKIEIIPNGPLMVRGTIEIVQQDGSVEIKENKSALCRCGASENKPYCDGAHRKIEFKG